ncbi:hypothetical protein AMTRI_Chr03g47550 [Amborella trichopoda]|uniref:uncharacterized protein LOC18430488 isoform X1 n=1 Tax=Amborella trichopoda TaxID=13333 RepID=UPI0005D3AA46|nr:uncharacterized protein LOC18430488 isoform X1 [Amborella trichopoda]|eukprot:XP_011621995.1 uncharacterized protein LOC18430488 isoform X1 [Amborella trichopoda]
MGLKWGSWVCSIWVFSALCFKVCTGDSGALSVVFKRRPLSATRERKAEFWFEVLNGRNGSSCGNCSVQCKLDEGNYSVCDSWRASYEGLVDGDHSFEVCINGASCTTFNWTVDTIPPTASVTGEMAFTSGSHVRVQIAFSEACSSHGGFKCSSPNSCNVLVYGAGHVIPSSLTVLEPNLKYSLIVELSSDVDYGRIILVMDKDFCTDLAGNTFTRAANSSFFVHFDRRPVTVNLTTHIPEKFLELENETRRVDATNDNKDLRIYLDFSEPILNSSSEILSVLHTSNGFLIPTRRRSLGNRRFGYLVQNISTIAVVTINLESSSIISRQGTPVSPIDPIIFLYDSQRPSVRLSTTSNIRTREQSMPVVIKFMKPVFDFNSSSISITGGHLQSFDEVSRNLYTAYVKIDSSAVTIEIPENITGDVAGNRNTASNLLQVSHYSVPMVSIVAYTITTAIFGVTSFAAGLLTISTASLQASGVLQRPSSSYLTSDPSRNLIRMAFHIQVFALSRWLASAMPVEFYEFSRGLQWSIPYIRVPWESHNVHFIMLASKFRSNNVGSHILNYGKMKKILTDSLGFGRPLTAMEYNIFFESMNMKPEAELELNPKSPDGWKEFGWNMFWLAIIGVGLMLLHFLLLLLLKWKGNSMVGKQKDYGAVVLWRFEIFLIMLALPCMCQAAAALMKGGSTAGVTVGILVLGIPAFFLLSLLIFLSLGITLGKLLQYKEIHQEDQDLHCYHDLIRVSLGPGKRGQWTWKNNPNSTHLTTLGPLFEDLRGPPKYMLSQFSGETSSKRHGQIIPSDDETEDAEATAIQKLFGILRIYYTLLECIKRAALGLAAGAISGKLPVRIPAIAVFSIAGFQLVFLTIKKPFIRKRMQLVEIVSVASEAIILGACMTVIVKAYKVQDQKAVGIFFISLAMIAFLTQVMNEWWALIMQIRRLSPDEKSFGRGLKMGFVGLVSFVVPFEVLQSWFGEIKLDYREGERGVSESGERVSGVRSSRGSGEKPWMRQLRDLAKASFGHGRDEAGPSNPRWFRSSNKSRSSSGSNNPFSMDQRRSRGLYKDFESLFFTR